MAYIVLESFLIFFALLDTLKIRQNVGGRSVQWEERQENALRCMMGMKNTGVFNCFGVPCIYYCAINWVFDITASDVAVLFDCLVMFINFMLCARNQGMVVRTSKVG